MAEVLYLHPLGSEALIVAAGLLADSWLLQLPTLLEVLCPFGMVRIPKNPYVKVSAVHAVASLDIVLALDRPGPRFVRVRTMSVQRPYLSLKIPAVVCQQKMIAAMALESPNLLHLNQPATYCVVRLA